MLTMCTYTRKISITFASSIVMGTFCHVPNKSPSHMVVRHLCITDRTDIIMLLSFSCFHGVLITDD